MAISRLEMPVLRQAIRRSRGDGCFRAAHYCCHHRFRLSPTGLNITWVTQWKVVVAMGGMEMPILPAVALMAGMRMGTQMGEIWSREVELGVVSPLSVRVGNLEVHPTWQLK